MLAYYISRLIVTLYCVSLLFTLLPAVEGEDAVVVREGRRRREQRGKKAQLVRKLMRTSRRVKEGSVRLVDGSNEHEGNESPPTFTFTPKDSLIYQIFSFGIWQDSLSLLDRPLTSIVPQSCNNGK